MATLRDKAHSWEKDMALGGDTAGSSATHSDSDSAVADTNLRSKVGWKWEPQAKVPAFLQRLADSVEA